MFGRPEERVLGRPDVAGNTAAGRGLSARVGRDEDQATWSERVIGRPEEIARYTAAGRGSSTYKLVGTRTLRL